MFTLPVKPLRPLGGKRACGYLRAVCLCALAAMLIFVPFLLVDGGFFHYAGDFNSQQITFYRYVNELVKSGASYAWSADLGSGVVNAYSFYLFGSPFFWFSLLFPAAWLPYLMCPLLALKFGVAGGGAYLYLRRYAKSDAMALVGACLYTFSGFSLYSIFFNHFVDVVALFPYLLWALDDAVYKGRRGPFAVFAALNLINNYFFFAGQIVFLVIYFVCKLASGEYKLTKKLFAALAIESLLGAAIGCAIAWPAVLSLAQNPRTVDLSSGWGFLTYGKPQQYLAILFSWVLPPDSPYLTSIWSEGVIKWTNMTAYLPMCSLAGVIAYARARRGGSTKKILAVCAVCALVPVLNSAFYCLNASYYARWWYMPVLLMALATMRTLQDPAIDPEPGVWPVVGIMTATLVFALVPVYDQSADSWSLGVLNNPGQYLAVIAFGLAGLLAYWWLLEDKGKPGFARRMLAAVLAFSCLFGVCHIAIGKFGQWETDSDLVEQYNGALELKQALPEGDWRIDTYETHDNLGAWLGKSGLQYFGSTVTPSILSFYPSVGVKRDVRSQPELNLYALRGLLGVQYMVVPADKTEAFVAEADAGWARTAVEAGGYVLYQNLNYAGMGFTYEYYITQEQFDATATNSRGNLLMRALLLTDEQIAQYGSLLQPLPESELYDLSYERYAADAADRRAAACTAFTMEKDGFTAQITLESEQLVFFSVPWDEGFTATVNGQPAQIEEVDGGLLAVVCPAGQCDIVVTYRTAGIGASSKISLAGCGLLAVYLGWFAWRRRRGLAPARAAAPACTDRPAPPPAHTGPEEPIQQETEKQDP